ncbi:MAG: YciI family protein [Hyphomicrobiales bacterium]
MAMSKNWQEFKDYVRSRGVMAKELFVVHSTPIVDEEEMGALMGEHLAYQKKLEAAGKLFAAGPMGDEAGAVWSREGLIILSAENLEEARALAQGDPMHAQGKKKFTVQPWLMNEGCLRVEVRLSDKSANLI